MRCREMERNKHGLFAVLFEMDACCAMLFCQNLKRHCDLLSCRWNELCVSHVKAFQLRLSHLQCAMYFLKIWVHMRALNNWAPNSLNVNKCHVDIDNRGSLDQIVAMNYWVHLQASADIDKCCPPTWLRLFQGPPILCQQLGHKSA